MDPSKRIRLLGILSKYLPEPAAQWALFKLELYGIRLRISGLRHSKMGDYRIPKRGEPHEISINFNLNPQAFALTLAHEIAHLETFNNYGLSVKPHGKEWQFIHWQNLKELVSINAFEKDVEKYILKRQGKHGASTCADPELVILLKQYDRLKNPRTCFLYQLPEGAKFVISTGKIFIKGPLQRTRFWCFCPITKNNFLIPSVCEVQRICSS